MNVSNRKMTFGLWRLALTLALCVTAPGARAAVPINQNPLTLSNNVPGNIVLTPSVEFPTVMSMANIGSFNPRQVYGGYFDSDKCYDYFPMGAVPVNTPAAQAAEPKGMAGYFVAKQWGHESPASCHGRWSGNFLNWAGTQTIDTFRSVMTGGYRVIDTTSLTVLEKARHTGQTNTGYLELSGDKKLLSSLTPSNFTHFASRLLGLGNKMYFVVADSGTYTTAQGVTISLHDLLDNPQQANGVESYTGQKLQAYHVYAVNMDVQVCVPGLLESNCVKYQSHYKPEGLIQKYANIFTYSVFGYLNVASQLQDGAALRAAQKFVGPNTADPITGFHPNPKREWDPVTGVFIQNPNPEDANSTSTRIGAQISDSGVINYINKFGQMTSAGDKIYDSVGEMYYAAVRYLKNQGPVASYSDMTTYSQDPAYVKADGFPVITQWTDPMRYTCQKNFILGIGDTNTWNDKNLPGNTGNHSSEPPTPPEVLADRSVDVSKATAQIAKIEGINISTPFTGLGNSAFIAGLAYDAHTRDIRPDLPGEQFVSSFWVDVAEYQRLQGMATNQYQLMAKYGGFRLPSRFDPYLFNGPMPSSWWSTNGDTLQTTAGAQPRPDNFFEGGNATAMRKGFSQAFALIESQNVGSQSSLALNSSLLTSKSRVYQASYQEGTWNGSLKAYAIDPSTKSVNSTPLWDAANGIPPFGQRKIFTTVKGRYVPFDSQHIDGGDWTADTVNYLLGDSAHEIRNGGSFRNRTTPLGDIVNSQPIYVGKPDASRFSGETFPGSDKYLAFASNSAASERTPVVYIAANDGMLHGFNADTGAEVYAFMPGALLNADHNPAVLAQANYGSSINPHRYFNDGQMTVADTYYRGQWHTILVGTTGRGETNAIYALDITDPERVQLLWEKSSGDSDFIGQMTGRPIVALTSRGWVALMGNGYNSRNGASALLSIPIDGQKNPKVDVYIAGAGPDNGLSTPTVLIDPPTTGVASEAYAGDIQGRLWKFDLTSPKSGAQLAFETQSGSDGVHQPITSAPLLGKDLNSGHLWGFFGTGRYLGTRDLTDKQVQSWYGLILDQTLPVTKAGLIRREIDSETAGVIGDPNTKPPIIPVNPARSVSLGRVDDMKDKQGWYINLVSPVNGQEGERMPLGNQFNNQLLVGTTQIPDTTDPCAPGGRGWVMAVNPFTGTNPTNAFFDLNNDGVIDSHDQLRVFGQNRAAAGIGFASQTGSPAFSGSVMMVNQNGTLQSRQTSPQAAAAQVRVSWREIVNQLGK